MRPPWDSVMIHNWEVKWEEHICLCLILLIVGPFAHADPLGSLGPGPVRQTIVEQPRATIDAEQ
jgi:hypothetical protein